MAIIKRIASNSSLAGIMRYVKNIEKTTDKILSGKDCTSANSLNKMTCTKKVWGKTDKRQYHHIIQSFLPGEVSPQIAHEIGERLAEVNFKNYEVLIATHIDREHYHNHLIVNSVSFVDGKKYKGTRQSLLDLKEGSDRLCREYGLSVIEKPYLKTRNTTAEKKLRGKGIMPWKDELRTFIDDAIRNTSDLSGLSKYLEFHYGVEVKIQNKNISFKHPDKAKFCRGKKLGIAWTKYNIERTFKENGKVISKKKVFVNKKNNQKSKMNIYSLKNGIIKTGQDISWDIKKKRLKQEIQKNSENGDDLKKIFLESKDDRGFEK